MSKEVTLAFLKRLWELQAEAGMSNAEVARILGCSPSYIRHMKAGRNAAQRFPELRSFFLPSELPVGNTDVLAGNESAEEGQQ